MSKITKLKEPILIEEDKTTFDAILKDLDQYTPLLEEVKKCFESLEIGEWNNKRLKELILDGTERIEKLYNLQLNAQLDSIKISSSTIRESMLKERVPKIKRLRTVYSDLKSFIPHRFISQRSIPTLPLESISFGKRGFFVSKADREVLLENHCRLYLDTDEEKEAYDALSEACIGYGKFKKLMEDIGFTYQHAGSFIHSFPIFVMDVENPVPNARAVKNWFWHRNLRLTKKEAQLKEFV